MRRSAVRALISAGVPFGHHSPLMHDRDAVREGVGLLQVMRGEHGGASGRLQGADLPPQAAPRLDVEPRRRLVEEDQLRIAGQRQREHHALLLAAGQALEAAPAHLLQPGHREETRHGKRVTG